MQAVRNIFIGLLLVSIITACVYGYFYFEKIKKPIADAVTAIPTNAFLIVETKNINETWKKISRSNLIWKDLIETDFFANLNQRLNYIDSVIFSKEEYENFLDEHTLYISFHVTEKKSTSFLISCGLKNTDDPTLLYEYLNKEYKPTSTQTESFEGATINTFKSSDEKPSLQIAFYKKILLLSIDLPVVKQAIIQLNSSTSLSNDNEFNKIRQTTGKYHEGALFINYKNTQAFLSEVFELPKELLSPNSVAAWTELDLHLKPNEILMSGYTAVLDTAKQFIKLYEGQKPQEINAVNIIPRNANYFLHSGISDMELFRKKIMEHYNTNAAITNFIRETNDKYNCNIEHSLSSWIRSEIISFSTNTLNNDTISNFAAFGCEAPRKAMEEIAELSKKINVVNKITNDTTQYRNHTLIHISLNKMLEHFWGGFITNNSGNYVSAIDNYIVFTNSIADLKTIIDDFESNKTLESDDYYLDFYNGHLNSESNIYFYAAIGNTADKYPKVLGNKMKKTINENKTILNKIQALGIQFSVNKKSIYTTAYIKHNPATKTQVSTLWETALDTSISYTPQIVINHKTKTKEIFIQDDANKIYLISPTGKILWKKEIEEKIMGDVVQIDALKNNKLQLLFNTTHHIYLIDRNGDHVKGFPLKLPAEASAPLAVLDYEQDKNYRIIIPCNNKIIYNYNADGTPVKGWSKPQSTEIIQTPIQYFSVKNFDHIIYIDSSGSVCTLNRQGEKRITLKEKLNNTTANYTINIGKEIEKTFITAYDTVQQTIVRLYMNDKKEAIKNEQTFGVKDFAYYDINNDKTNEYILLGEKQLRVLNSDEMTLFEKEFSNKLNSKIFLFNTGSKGMYTGVVSDASEEIFLFQSSGQEAKGLPVKGKGAFAVGDINKDQNLILIGIGTSNSLFAYQIE